MDATASVYGQAVALLATSGKAIRRHRQQPAPITVSSNLAVEVEHPTCPVEVGY